MIVHTAQPASAGRHRLAEGPHWDTDRSRLLWVDITAAEVREGTLEDGWVTPTRTLRLSGLGPTVGAVVPAEDGRLLVVGHRGVVVIAPDGTRSDTLPVIPDDARSRLNDGACDPAGRLVVGSLPYGATAGTDGGERLVRLEDDGTLTVLDDDLSLANGLAWSPDGDLLYSVDTTPGTVWVRDYDASSGRTGPRRELLHVADGLPDGLCVDADGNLWLAVWGTGQVRCFAPDGEQTAVVQVPAPHTSSVAFVGPDLDLLLVTTASAELSEARLARYPDSGRLFTVDVGVRGLPATPWNGRGAPQQHATH